MRTVSGVTHSRFALLPASTLALPELSSLTHELVSPRLGSLFFVLFLFLFLFVGSIAVVSLLLAIISAPRIVKALPLLPEGLGLLASSLVNLSRFALKKSTEIVRVGVFV
jgi:hypothetical protein